MKSNSNLKRSANPRKSSNNLKKRKQCVEADSKTTKRDLYRAPTVEELNQLRETEILFNSNLFRLQTEELVKEVSLKEKRKREINNWVEKFEQIIRNIPEYDEVMLSDFGACLEQIKATKLKGALKKISKNNPVKLKADQNAPMKFLKPCSVEITGLYSLNATIGPTHYVTINIVIPKNTFHAKDYLNCRYLAKRSLYLSYIANHLINKENFGNIKYTYLNDNELYPILYIEPNNIKKTIFKVLVTPEKETFKPLRFEDNKSNIRFSYWRQLSEIESEEDENIEVRTKWYNSLLAHDVQLQALSNDACSTLKDLPGTRDALRLMQVWLLQRRLYLQEQLLLTLASRLVQAGSINRHMSSYQAVRALFIHLTKAENPLSNTPAGIEQRVRQQAEIALKLLDTADLASFQTLFMTPMPEYLQYDASINIYLSPELDNLYNSIEDKLKVEYLNYKYPVIENQVIQELKTALTDRADCIVPLSRDPIIWNVGERAPSPKQLFLNIGLCLNPDNMLRVVDKGPPAYDPQAPAFRDFWGDKAELRRFKDGSICEAVYWPAESMCTKRAISKQIIEFVLKDKLNLEDYNITYNNIENIIGEQVEERNLHVVREFDILAKKLRELQLPLSIASVAGISDVFSHSDPFPPIPRNYSMSENNCTYEWQETAMLKDKQPIKEAPDFVAPIEAVIQMVQHSKWPSEPEAMRALRGALFLQMSRELRNSALLSRASYDHLDIVSGGLVIRLELFHPREHEREQRCIVLPRVRGGLSGLRAACPSLPLGAAIAQRWVRAQLLDFPDAVVELLVAAACVEQRVALPQRVFLCFLALVAQHSWATQPLYLELSQTEREPLDAEFQAQRNNFPALCIFTPWDLNSSVSKTGPNEFQLNRLRILAKNSLQLIEQEILNSTILAALFKPNLRGYNVLIHLNPKLNARRRQALFNQERIDYAEYDPTKPSKIPVIAFNPAEKYLQELREYYDDFAIFFHDIHGGNVIAVLWKPNITEKREFKVSQVAGTKLLADEQKLQVNIDAIIEDFYILGEGLVNNIEVM